MSAEMSIVKLGDVADFQEGYVNPSQKVAAYFDGPYKWLRATDLNNGFVKETGRTLSEEGFLSAKKAAKLFLPGTLAISKSGTIGRLGILKDYMCGNRAVINIVPRSEMLDTLFCFYTLMQKHPEILNLADGSVQKNLYCSSLGSLEIQLPPLRAQQLIGSLLHRLDEYADTLKVQNTTLEALAQTLFRSWFVNFDPVHAKAAGLTPEGMSPELAALFPSEFVESKLGMIPKGWKMAHFSDLAQRAKKSINPGKLPDVTFTHFSIPAFDSKGMPTEELGSAIMSNKTLIETPAVLQSKLNPHKPRIWRISKPEKNYVCSTEFLAWSALNPSETHFLDSLLRSDFFIEKTLELVSGTSNSHQRAKPGDIESIDLILPQSELREKYSLLVSTLNDSIDTNTATVKVLAQLRDELLPRLISGKLRIEEAEEAVFEVLGSTTEEVKAA